MPQKRIHPDFSRGIENTLSMDGDPVWDSDMDWVSSAAILSDEARPAFVRRRKHMQSTVPTKCALGIFPSEFFMALS